MCKVDEDLGSVREAAEQLVDEVGTAELAEDAAVVLEVLGNARERVRGLPWKGKKRLSYGPPETEPRVVLVHARISLRTMASWSAM